MFTEVEDVDLAKQSHNVVEAIYNPHRAPAAERAVAGA
jgi:hypothetical protein